MAGNIENELNQLKEQIKLLERMVYLKNNVSSSEEYITKYMETQAKLSNMMKNYNMDSYNHEKKLLELLKQKAEIEEKRAKSAKERASAEKESIKNNETLKEQNKKIVEQNTEIIRQEEKYAKVRAAKRVNEALSSGSKSKAEQQSDARKTFAMNNPNLEGEALKKALIKNKLVDSETSSYMKDILKSFKVGNKNVGDYVNMNEKGISSAAQLLNVGVQTFNEAVKVFSNAVSQGFKNQTQSYESNFTNIAVRTGMTKDTYRGNQMSLGGFGTNILHERGLMNNIRTSEVQDMWNSLANTGMSQSDILASSLESVITKTIVPYLDITTDEMQQFNQNVGDNGLLKQVRGITKVSNEMFGGSQVATKYLQEQLEYLAPMSKVAEIDLVENTAEGMLALQGMRQSGMSDSAIAEILKDTRMLQEDHFGALTSGKMPLSLGAFEAEKNGVNTYEDFSGSLQSVLSGYGQIQNFIPTNSSMQSSIVSSAYGTKGTVMYELAKLGLDYDSIIENAKKGGKKVPQAGQEVTNSLAGDEFHTTRQLTDILAENLTNEVSAFAEMLGPWFDVLTTAVKGIAGILGVKLIGKIGGKLLGNGGGNLLGGSLGGKLGSAGTFLNAGLQQGFAKGSTTFIGAGKLGFMNSTAGAAAGVAGVAAGAAMGVDGGIKAYENFKKGDKMGGALRTTEAVAGVGGAAALLALGASNPIGWVALGVGAVAMFAAKAHEHNEALKDTVENNKAMAKDVKERWDNFNSSIKDELETRQTTLQDMKTELENGKDVEAVRTELINSGILSEEQVNDLRKAEGDALQTLVNTYLTETGKLSGVAEEVSNAFSDYEQEVAGGARNEIARYLNDHKGNEEGNAHYDEVYDAVKTVVDTTYKKKRDGGSLSKDEEKLLEKWEWASEDDDVSRSDLKHLINSVGDHAISQMLTKNDLTKLASGRSGKSYGEHMTNYQSKKLDITAAELITKAAYAPSKEQAISYLKQSGYTPESADPYKTQINNVMSSTPWGIQWTKEKGYFRTGTDSIPYDNYPALLHEGEAVLTASTANELRGLVDEYRATKEDNIKLEKAIQDQTNALVTRLDAIYNKIGNPDSDTSIMPRKIRQWKSNGR